MKAKWECQIKASGNNAIQGWPSVSEYKTKPTIIKYPKMPN